MTDAKNPDWRVVSKISGHFFVPSYQRGYRWGRHEVDALLNDIYADGKLAEGVKYCLQPIVVKAKAAPVNEEGRQPVGNTYYELIDGQQRLTTLYLLYLHLKKIKGIVPSFTLSYETRPGSTLYLSHPIPEQQEDNIDFFHIFRAYQCIEEWFDKAARRTDDGQVMGVADDIYRYLRNQVHVIWYDSGDEDAITLFTRLNVGRIALTNAELVKARLLARKSDDLAGEYSRIEIATQWEMIEQELQNDAFWAFLTNRPGADYPTRIELLFDLLAGKTEKERDLFFTFEYFRQRLAEQDDEALLIRKNEGEKRGPLKIWSSVLELYDLLREWFDDRHRYHKVGYLVATGDKLSELVAKVAGEDPLTKSAFLAYLDERIRERLDLDEDAAKALDYEKNYSACERLLLLFNVESVRLLEHSSERYPFYSHKKEKWSLEHIHAQNAAPLQTEKEWRESLKDSRRALAAIPRLDDVASEAAKVELVREIDTVLDRKQVDRNSFTALSARIMEEVLNVSGTEAEEHSIANLALLSGKVNSALNNGSFQAKRLRITDCDQKGEFIPICTRRVFFKYYTPVGNHQAHLWSREDRETYLDAMLAPAGGKRKEGIIRKYLKPGRSTAETQL